MKRLQLVLLSVIVIVSSLSAQSRFTVSVGTFVEAGPQDFANIRSLAFIYKVETQEGLQQIYAGGFDQEAKASQLASTIKGLGYPSAQAITIPAASENSKAVIQIATRYVGKTIDWTTLQNAGPLNVQLENDRIKILTGIFPDANTAKNALPSIQAQGFSDAFVKMVDANQLIPVTAFSTGVKEPLIPLDFSNTATLPTTTPPAPTSTPATTPSTQVVLTPTPNTPTGTNTPSVPRPSDYDQPANTTPRTPNASSAVAVPVETVPAAQRPPAPDIRSRVKRRSALDLQQILKAQGYYSGSLDGYYGDGTATAYNAMLAQDATLIKYRLLAQHMPTSRSSAPTDALQRAINALPYDPNAPIAIEQSTHYMGKAYQAYQLFTTLGASATINTLMNQANRAAYAGVSATQAPFDYQATYAYQDIDQLLLHLHYLHAAPGNAYQLPCWMNQRHAATLQKTSAAVARLAVRREACTGIDHWEEVALLQTIAYDLGASAPAAGGNIALEALLARERELNPAETATVAAWHQTLWNKLDAWAGKDPFLTRNVQALKVAYFQTQVRLEDYFMEQGFASEDAKSLAIAALRVLTEGPLGRFLR